MLSMVSVTWVTALARLIASCSKSPPLVLVIFAWTEPASMYGSSPGALMVMLPWVAPLAMVMLSPLLSAMVIAVPALLDKVAV
ncbi:hypothetical protein D3C72_2145700 [compost metagenome]